MRIALAGGKGSFSHEAAELYSTGHQFTDVDYVFSLDSEGVLQALDQQQADLGIMPIYNPTGGLVGMTLAAMGRHLFTVQANFDMPVIQCLLALPTVRPDVIRTIVSHEQALKQCQRYLDTHWPECQLREYNDTAQAAVDLVAGKLPTDSAVLAPKLCAELYGLHVIAESIQDDTQNRTWFIVVKK